MVRHYGESYNDDYRKKLFGEYLEHVDNQIEKFHKSLLIKTIAGVYGDNVTVVSDDDHRKNRILIVPDPVIRTIWLLVKRDKTFIFEIRRNNIEALKVLIAKVYPGVVELINTIPGKCEPHKIRKKTIFELLEVKLVFEVKEKPTPIIPWAGNVGTL